jgi:hypothetical protein
MDAELNEDDPARLSVSAKASMFKNILENKSASGAKLSSISAKSWLEQI